jgi:PAS domain S-box-containing protein
VVGEHGQEWHPRPDLVAILLGHHAGDLRDVPEIVYHPAREQVPQGDAAEARMVAGEVELGIAQAPGAEQLEVRVTQFGEFGQQRFQGAAHVAAAVAEAIVRLEARVGAASQDDAGAGDPVGFLAVYEMTDHVEGAEGIGPFGAPGPGLGDSVEEHPQCRGASAEHIHRGFQLESHTAPAILRVPANPGPPLHNELGDVEAEARCKPEPPVRLSVTMRDQHRPKQELCDEVAALRKQVADLKAEMVVRRRVEDALRLSEEQLRTLADSSPAGLCIIRPGGTVRAANLPFARLLGYDSAAELQRLSEVLGIFAGREELERILAMAERGDQRMAGVVFRRKDGSRQSFGVLGAARAEADAVAIAVLEQSSVISYQLSVIRGVRADLAPG